MEPKDIFAGLVTIVVATYGAYFNWKLGKLQTDNQARTVNLTDSSSREAAFRDDLFEHIEKQEEKIKKQDDKLDKLVELIDDQRALIQQLKQANFDLTIYNDKLKRRIEDLEREAILLKKEIENLKQGK